MNLKLKHYSTATLSISPTRLVIQTLYVFRFSFTRNISTLSFDNAPSEQSLGVELVHPKPKELLIVFFSFQPFTFEQ